ncbi:MAG TPA: ATP-binding protein [Ignavibacteriaceae bacterium]|nr:ATP-binding protein [Ignavibacteriaceae bacterium]
MKLSINLKSNLKLGSNSKHIIKKIVIKSKTENLSEIRNFISENAIEAGLKQVEIDDMILAVDEACTNIIKHAYKSYPEGEILIEVDYNNKKFTIKLIDYGTSFDPESIPDPDLQKYYRQRRVGGLGLYLMRTLMDDVQYISVPGKYNQVLLSKNLNNSN